MLQNPKFETNPCDTIFDAWSSSSLLLPYKGGKNTHLLLWEQERAYFFFKETEEMFEKQKQLSICTKRFHAKWVHTNPLPIKRKGINKEKKKKKTREEERSCEQVNIFYKREYVYILFL